MIGIILLVLGIIIAYVVVNLFNIYFIYITIRDREYIWSLIPITIILIYNGLILFILGI